MASWKKVIISGSNISQLANDANYITSAGTGNSGNLTTTAVNGSGNIVATTAALDYHILVHLVVHLKVILRNY
jgi:hypothetical protein